MRYSVVLVILILFVSCDRKSDSQRSILSVGEEKILSKEVLLDKIRGGLLGQILGNLNGLEHEMQYIDQPGEVVNYVPALPEGAWTDDDTDFEWVYIYLMQQENTAELSRDRLKEVWISSINRRIWCSNRYARHLMDIDIVPPYTGKLVFNPWAEFNISGQFICETFGLTAPAMPVTASKIGLNYTMVTIDHEPAQTTQLFTSMIAMAYIENNLEQLIQYGLQSIDSNSQTHTIVNDVVAWYKEFPDDWEKTRKELKEKYTQDNNGIRDMNGYELNTGAVIGALLHGGGDFKKTLELAFNFGWDCDNVAATAGTILGVIHGYRWMMSQGWNIVDRYKNTTRDNMPKDETITSFSDRIFDIALKNIVSNGGDLMINNGIPSYRIMQEEPENVYPLMDLSKQIEKYSTEFKDLIDEGIVSPADQTQNAKAAYLAICLDLWPLYAENYPEKWREASNNLASHWKIMQNIFYKGSFGSMFELRERFIAAGFAKPNIQFADSVVWNDTVAWRKLE